MASIRRQMAVVGEVRVWWAKLGYLNDIRKCNVFSIIPLHILFTFLISKLPKDITKILHRNYDFKTYFHNFIEENVEKWAKLGYHTLHIFISRRQIVKVKWLHLGPIM